MSFLVVVRVHIAKCLNDQRSFVKLVERRGRREAPLERLVHLGDHHLRVFRRRVLHWNAVYFAVRREVGNSRTHDDDGLGVHYKGGGQKRSCNVRQEIKEWELLMALGTVETRERHVEEEEGEERGDIPVLRERRE